MTSAELRRDAKLIREHGCVADPRLLERAADEIDRLEFRVADLAHELGRVRALVSSDEDIEIIDRVLEAR